MHDSTAIDWTTQSYLDTLSASGAAAIATWDHHELRHAIRRLAEANGPGPDMYHLTDEVVSTPQADLPVRVLIPMAEPRGILLFYHGGGWVAGSIDEFDTVARKLAERTGCAVVLAEYRLAPEHQYPSAVVDAHAVCDWVHGALMSRLGTGLPVMVGGEGVGATLAALVAGRRRTLALQIRIEPVVRSSGSASAHRDADMPYACSRADLAR